MTERSKGKIRHFAFSVKDPWETAEFYKDVMGLEEVSELDGPLAEGIFLTDGVVNLALLHFKDEEASQGFGTEYVGLHHIGFWVDDVIQSSKQAVEAGAKWMMGDVNNPHGYEVKHWDLSGIVFDVAEHGWAGAQKNPGEADNRIHPNPHRRLAKFDARRETAHKAHLERKAAQARVLAQAAE